MYSVSMLEPPWQPTRDSPSFGDLDNNDSRVTVQVQVQVLGGNCMDGCCITQRCAFLLRRDKLAIALKEYLLKINGHLHQSSECITSFVLFRGGGRLTLAIK